MNSYRETLRFLFDLQLFGIKLGLENIRALAAFWSNPEKNFPSVHIAGTNGKGSTSSIIAAVLTASGYRTGLYTSPHLLDFTERIRIDGIPITRGELVGYVRDLSPQIRRLRATFFEATTAIAFKFFSDRRVDIAVIETGLGGRLDATNIITPKVSVITNVGLDHTQHLGKSFGKIAAEKAGIIKPFVPCVTGARNPEVLRKIRSVARSRKSPITEAGNSSAVCQGMSLSHLVADVRTPLRSYTGLRLSLTGSHQLDNLLLSLLTLEELGISLREKNVRAGLSQVRRWSGLRGRLEVLRKNPFIIADVAHNPDGAEVLAKALRDLGSGKCTFVFGVMADKDFPGIISQLKPIARRIIAVRPAIDRALESRAIVEESQRRGIHAVDAGAVSTGIRRSLAEPGNVIVTGSHYVVGEAMSYLKTLKT